jgi:hypothetical protein
MFSLYAGPARLTWSWYGFDIDPVKGPVGLSETMNAWRNIAKAGIKSVWVGAGGTGGPTIAGIWMWHPSAFNENNALKEVNRNIGLGGGTFDSLMSFEKNTLPLVALFKTYINSWTSEFHVKTREREHPLNTDDLTVYWKNFQEAEKALNTAKIIIGKEQNVYRPLAANRILNDMRKTLDLLKPKLIRKLKRKGITVSQ